MDTSPKPGDHIITPQTGPLTLSGAPVKSWLHAPFAREWYRDAVREAQTGQDAHARRREVLFAVCCAESYLLEWVGVDVLKRDYDRLLKYFPTGAKWGVLRKWAEVPKALKRDGLIPETPMLDTKTCRDFRTLVADYRDGLVHARASRPHSQSQTPDANPFPTIEALQALPAGWAVAIVTEQIRALNSAAGTSVPDWVIDRAEERR